MNDAPVDDREVVNAGSWPAPVIERGGHIAALLWVETYGEHEPRLGLFRVGDLANQIDAARRDLAFVR